jgi:transposase InsO family protein
MTSRMDATVDCGRDGWCAFVPVVDCCSREVLGWKLAHEPTAPSCVTTASPDATHPINKSPEHHWLLSNFEGCTTLTPSSATPIVERPPEKLDRS